jgi:4-azaleucine resistance transporter AzlC
MFKTLKLAFPLTVPVMLGYVSVGIAFGILVMKSGLSIWAGILMSAFVYAGAMQFVAIQLLLSPISLIQIAIMTIFVNIRHLFYGLSFIDLFKTFGSKKHYMVFALTDETYSLLCALALKESTRKENLFFAVSFLNQIYWFTGTLIGLLIGTLITFNTDGIEFAMTALFVIIFIEQWLAFKTHRPALFGLGAAVVALAFAGPTNMILPSMLIILALLIVSRKWIEIKEEEIQ